MGAIFRLVAGMAALSALSGCVATRQAGPDPLAAETIEADLRAHITILASDEFEGRKPGTEGERKTLRYLAEAWQAAGLVSATNDPAHPWFAPVDLDLRAPESSSARFSRKGRYVAYPENRLKLFTAARRALIEGAPVLFVGPLGGSLEQPELTGRVAVLFAENDSRAAQREALVTNGAAAVLTIFTDNAQFENEALARANGGFRLTGESDGAVVDGIMAMDAAQALLGADRVAALLEQARMDDFRPVPLDLKATLEARSTPGTVRTHNLIAKLPGSDPAAGAVMLLAHWDHFGTCGDDASADRVCNGAVDNASGLAVLTELARRLANSGRMDRDVYFVATTAEEWGLLGARAFTRDPPLPLESIVAAFNIDTIALAPAGGPVAIVGQNLTTLDSEVEGVINRAGRKVAERDYAARFVRRQDGWALLQSDVPTLMISSAFARPDLMQRYSAERYHRANDEIGALELGGAAEDVLLHMALVRHFASKVSHP